MALISVKVEGLDRTLAHIDGMGKQVRFATAVALTKTAGKVRDAMPAQIDQDLDRPTPFTRAASAMYLRPARKDALFAEVGYKDRQAAYLKYQIEGGTRRPGPRGIKLPGNIQLNSFGNIPKGTIDKLKAAAKDGSLSTAIAKRLNAHGNRRKGAAPVQLFVGKPTGKGWEDAPMGIWRRIPGSEAHAGKLVPVIVFEDTPAHYRPRFKFHEAAQRVVTREWSRQFDAAFADAMRTAR